ncbi:hypothetical protein CEXT_417511 [Caerostris extrusa]|uniref:Uncharacterized protein n=1 Tax=Caerostris extrusa TaxID=172846 RepID=A0AAV4VN39_CAEEX|nr:hypothetical protein CEXT_417511 [Caerostris extrusa]
MSAYQPQCALGAGGLRPDPEVPWLPVAWNHLWSRFTRCRAPGQPHSVRGLSQQCPILRHQNNDVAFSDCTGQSLQLSVLSEMAAVSTQSVLNDRKRILWDSKHSDCVAEIFTELSCTATSCQSDR